MPATSLLPALVLAAVSPVPCTAERGQAAADCPPPEVIIEASRTRVAAFDYPGSASTVSNEELGLLAATHASEAINRVPGAFLQRGSGQEVLVALRSPVLAGPGACGAFLVMEDGLPLRPVGSCNVNELFEVNLEQAAGLEVVRGPGLGPQGANALHGLINVRSVALDAPFRAGLEFGQHGYSRVKLQGSFATASGADTSAANGINDSTSRLAFAFHTTRDGGWRDATGFHEQKGNLKWGTPLAGGQLTLNLAGTNLDQETGGFIAGLDSYRSPVLARSNANPEAFRQASALRLLGRWQEDAADGWELSAYARASRMRFLQHFLLGKPLERNGQQSAGVVVSRGLDFVGAQWRLGFDAETANSYLVEYQAGPTLEGTTAARAIRPAGFHYDYRVQTLGLAPWLTFEKTLAPRWTLSGSLRADRTRYQYDNRMRTGNTSDTGATCTGGCLYSRPADRSDRFNLLMPRLGLAWRLNDGLSAWASVGRGFRPPEATELYRLQRQQSVADLQAETARSAELGLRGRGAGYSWSLATYAMEKQHVILRDASAFNVSDGRTRHRGVEFEGAWAATTWLTLSGEANFANHTYRFNRAAEQGERIVAGNEVDTAPRRLHALRASVVPVANTRMELEWVAVGPYFADAANTARYPGHDLLNLRAAWTPTPRWTVSLRVTNLTDRAYADRADLSFGAWRYFPGRPRKVFVEVDWQP
jgi:outer membrane receptor protein involved in Fe transport